MQERNFVAALEKRAEIQRKLAHTEMIPEWAKGFGDWLAINPWRVMVPLSGIGYVVCRIWIGVRFSELVLGLFGGFQ